MIVILLSEICVQLCISCHQSCYIILHRIFIVVGIALFPVIPFVLLPFAGDMECNRQKRLLLSLPLLIHVVLSLASLRFDLYCRVDSMNHCIAGPLLPIVPLLAFFYFLLLLVKTKRNFSFYGHATRSFFILLIIFALIVFSSLFFDLDILTINNGITMVLLLYYIFTLERQFDFDIQTGVRNRDAFENILRRLGGREKNVTLFVFDLNNLKLVNDNFGHEEGDYLIFEAAQAICTFFGPYGATYRIGGDEFCVISRFLTDASAIQLLKDFDVSISLGNMVRTKPVSLAHGFASVPSSQKGGKNILEVFEQADASMYAHKAQLKDPDQ
jgi:diguanylate cyclase (GGDEF)-like protein